MLSGQKAIVAANLLSLDRRVVVVAGAAGGGIGTTVTRMVAEAGATVIAVSRSPQNLDDHIAPLIEQGLSIVPVAADVATDDGVAAAMEQPVRADGELHGLVNVAGGAAPSTWMPSTRVNRSDWRDLFAHNLETTFFMSQAVAAELKARQCRGSIVSISSISGMNTAPFHIAYGTAKAAVAAMTRTMAVELAPDEIRVNADAPRVTPPPAAAAVPSRWADAAVPRKSPAPSCFCCRTCPATSPARRFWWTAAWTSNGHIWTPPTPRFSSKTTPSERRSGGFDDGSSQGCEFHSGRRTFETDDDRCRSVYQRDLRPRRARQAVAKGLATGWPCRRAARGGQLPDLRHSRRLDHRGAHRRQRI